MKSMATSTADASALGGWITTLRKDFRAIALAWSVAIVGYFPTIATSYDIPLAFHPTRVALSASNHRAGPLLAGDFVWSGGRPPRRVTINTLLRLGMPYNPKTHNAPSGETARLGFCCLRCPAGRAARVLKPTIPTRNEGHAARQDQAHIIQHHQALQQRGAAPPDPEGHRLGRGGGRGGAAAFHRTGHRVGRRP